MTHHPVFVAMVRAHCIELCMMDGDDRYFRDCIFPDCSCHADSKAMEAALKAAAALGWKLTPRKRTPAMVKATDGACGGIYHDATVWRDTFDAAPDITKEK